VEGRTRGKGKGGERGKGKVGGIAPWLLGIDAPARTERFMENVMRRE